MRNLIRTLLAAVACAGIATTALAGNTAPEPPSWQSAWEYAQLYRSDSGPLRSLDLSGRLQAEGAWFDSDRGSYDDTLWRRFRFGFRADLPANWGIDLEADFDLNESAGNAYTRITDAYLRWSNDDDSRTIKLLKQSAGFTLDGATSSKKLLTLQRNNLTGNLWFTAEYFSGAVIAGESRGGAQYKLGVFSSDGSDEIGIDKGGYFTLASAGIDLAAATGLDDASLRLDYVYNDRDREANTPDFSHVVSLSGQWRKDRWHLRSDIAVGDGHYQQDDLFGIVLMPYYNLDERWQVLVRYTFIDSDGDGGIGLNRYDDEFVDGTGDRYREVYLGLNAFFNGHKLKWQTGLQYAVLDNVDDGPEDYDGWGITTGLRLYW